MPRRRGRRPKPPDPVGTDRPIATPIGAPPGWTAQRYRAREAGPDYTCPRCTRTVARTSDHVVAWTGDQQHRHWHKGCWEAAVREGLDRYRWG